MHALRQTRRSAPALLTPDSRPSRAQPFLLAPVRGRPIDRIFPSAIVRCMSQGRLPFSHEVEAVAARIWSDIQRRPQRILWDEVTPGCDQHRRILAAARAARGDTPRVGGPP